MATAATAEKKVLDLIVGRNAPHNSQGVADMMAQYGIKKTQCQKTLDALAEKGALVCKEFGKQKLYFPPQEGKEVLSEAEMKAQSARAKELQAQLTELTGTVHGLEKQLSALQRVQTEEQLDAALEASTTKVEAQRERVAALKGAARVAPEEAKAVAEAFSKAMDTWRKRKRVFRNIWDAATENMDGTNAELYEKIGIEADGDISHAELLKLLPPKQIAKRPRTR